MRKDHQTGNDPDHWSDREKLDLGSPLKREVVRGSSGPRPRSPAPLSSPAMIRAAALLLVLVVPGVNSGQCDDYRFFKCVLIESCNSLPLFQVTTVTTSRTVVSRFRFPTGRRPFGISEPV